jgi:hypothetical protein
MNWVGIATGALLFCRGIAVLRQNNFQLGTLKKSIPGEKGWKLYALIGSSLFFLLWVGISGLNARANFILEEKRFEYFKAIRWLPHSYHRDATELFWFSALALAFTFWGTYVWLLSDKTRTHDPSTIPRRIRILLWVITINGAVLGLVGVFQRFTTDKLLWILQPHFNSHAEAQFGPFAYRGSAGSYFNLLWPVALTLAYWSYTEFQAYKRRKAATANTPGWQQSGGRAEEPEKSARGFTWSLLATAIIAMAPLVAASRGAIISAAAMVGLIFWVFRKREKKWFLLLGLVTLAFIAAGWWLSGDFIERRLAAAHKDQWSGRLVIYSNALQMLKDFWLLGSGAGSFEALYLLYANGEKEIWHSYVHNDWLEYLITVGVIGFAPLLLNLVVVTLRARSHNGILMAREAQGLLIIALISALIHAITDFPFQIYSVVHLFLTICAILFASGTKQRSGG